MSRRRAAIKREVLPDHKYKDTILTKFMNRIMLDGKKMFQKRLFMALLTSFLRKQKKNQ